MVRKWLIFEAIVAEDDMPDKADRYRNDLLKYFLIAFAWSWLLNLPRLLASAGIIMLDAGLSGGLGYAAAFGPSVAAFGLTFSRARMEGVRALWGRGWNLRFPKKWLIPALLLMPALGLVTMGLMALFGQPIPWEYVLPPVMIVPIGVLIWLVGAYPEEYGWRGYALDRLQDRFNPLGASLILGVLWGLWHLPLHFIEGTTQAVIPVWEFVLQTILLSVLYTWLFNKTGGSVLVASLFHAAGNLTGAVIPYWVTSAGRWLSLIPLLIAVILVVVFN